MTAPNPMVVHIPAGLGIDQSLREEHVQPGAANLYQQNVRLTRQGSLIKRPGFAATSNARVGTGSRSAGLRLASYRDALVVSDGDQLDIYSPAMTQWTQCGRLPACRATIKPFSSTSMPDVGAHLVDVAYSSSANMYAVASLEMSNATSGYKFPVVRIVDGTTLKVIKSFNLASGTVGLTYLTDFKLAVVGANLVAVWGQTNGGLFDICMARLDLAAVESGFAATVTKANNYVGVGLAVHALSSSMALAYQNDAGGTARITTLLFNPSVDALTTSTSTSETTSSATVYGIALAGSEELWTVWGYFSSGTVHASARNTSTLASVIATTSVMTVDAAGSITVTAGRTAASTIYVAVASADGSISGWAYTKTARLNNNSGVLTTDRRLSYIGGWVPASTPFAVNGRVYIEMAYDDTAGDIRDTVLVDITADASTTGIDRNETVRPVAWLSPRSTTHNVSTVTSGYGGPYAARHSVSVSASVYASVHLVRTSSVTTSLAIAKYDFGSSLRHLPLVYADNLYLAGNLLYQFDGERVYENGFIVPPRISLTNSGSGITGTFSYTAIHEYTDALGNVVWSAPAPVQTVTVTDDTVTVKVRRPSVTWKEGYDGNTDLEPQGLRRTKTKIFRTLSTGTGDFYLLATIQTNPAAGAVTYSDAADDSTISSNAKLYKTPGIVGTAKDRQAVGSVLHATECNGVLVVIDADGSTLRAFAQRTVGESPWHHDTLQLAIDGDGELVALASLDGALVVFKRDSVYLVPVEPASDNMTVGGFGSPRRIAADVGCIDPRSVVVTGKGVFFQSDRGIELLTRSLVVEQIGVKVQDTFDDYPNVTAAVLDARNGLVRFSCAQTDSSTVGVDLVFDLVAEQWVSVDDKYGAAAHAQSVSAAYGYTSNGWYYAWLDSVGKVRTESPETTAKRDGTQWITAKWETPWIKTELQREHQFWQGILLYEQHGLADLTAECAFDWEAYGAGDNKVWTNALLATNSHQVELRVTGRRQAVKFRFADSEPAIEGATGDGLEYIGLSIDLAPHQGPTQGTPRLDVAVRK